MEPTLCKEKHKRIDETLNNHSKATENHENRICELERSDAAMGEKISGLITQLGSLNTTLKWFIGLLIGAFISFFFYAVQQGVIK